MKRLISVVIVVICILSVSACSFASSRDVKEEIADILGLDLSDAAVALSIDSHGGFHGDGETHVMLGFNDKTCLKQIEKSEYWKPFPLSENLTALVYGIRTEDSAIGPYISFPYNTNNTSAMPIIENGYYYFLDRHSDSTDAHDDTNVLARPSFNLTIAMYDADTDILYYCEFDT